MEVCLFYYTMKWFVSRNAGGKLRFNELLLTNLEIERRWMNMMKVFQYSETLQELGMLSTVTLNCWVSKMNSDSQLSVL